MNLLKIIAINISLLLSAISLGYSADNVSEISKYHSGLKAYVGAESVHLWWNPAPKNSQIHFVLVRNKKRFPQNANDGKQVYSGKKSTCIDKRVINGRHYYYSLFVQKDANSPAIKSSEHSSFSLSSNQIYFGSSGSYQNPACINLSLIMSSLYSEESKLDTQSSEYWLFVTKLNKALSKVFREINAEEDVDFIIEKSSIDGLKWRDLTEEVAELLQKSN